MSEEEAAPAPTEAERLRESWAYMVPAERAEHFLSLPRVEQEEFFTQLPSREQAGLFESLGPADRKLWIRFLAPDDATDLLQELSNELRAEALSLTDQITRGEIIALLSYREDEAGGLMSPRYVRVRPEMLVAEAIRYVRQQARAVDPIHYVYVLDPSQQLLGVWSLRQLFVAPAEAKVSEIMERDIVTVPDEMDQESVSQIFQKNRFVALPVVDSQNRMQGIVTLDDILDVSQEEATEDIHKLGAIEALDAPYPDVPLVQMIKKRAGWLTLLFVGEMFTATAMSQFEDEIAKAVVLALFVPLIISSGGNSGSQATSLIIRAMALQELKLSDWWRVFIREAATGLALGTLLASIGVVRIMIWPNRETIYTSHYLLVAYTVAVSLVGVVLFGSLAGSMLPFILRKFKLDPASASAPMVATLVDVSGLVIYFTIAKIFLSGTLL